MSDKLTALWDDLNENAYDPTWHKYYFKEANQIIRKHFESLLQQEQPKFKEGDKVVLVEDYNEYWSKGEKFVVQEDLKQGSYLCKAVGDPAIFEFEESEIDFQQEQPEQGWIEQVFNAGFDEGYTNPMELDGKLITEKEYEQGRKENFEAWLPEFLPEPPNTN